MSLRITVLYVIWTYTVTEQTLGLGCYGIDNGGWQLVRHSYNKWHQAEDDLKGTETYGTFINDPEADSYFSIEFKPDDTTEFMFSNGDCSQYLITTFSEFNGPRPVNPYLALIKQSHLDSNPDYKYWFFDANQRTQPYIAFDNLWDSTYDCLQCLYKEFFTIPDPAVNRFGSDPYINVFIRSGTDITFGFKIDSLTSTEPFTITFWWGTRIFECSVVPRRQFTLYTCNSEASTTKECIPSASNSVYAMQISNPSNDDAEIDDIFFKEGNNLFTKVAVPDDWVGNNGGHYRYYDLVDPSNLPSSVSGQQRTGIPQCQTDLSTDGDHGVYCPVSNANSMVWSHKDVGFNIFSSSSSRDDDCVLRFSQRHSNYNNIATEWIDPNQNLVIFSHGWNRGGQGANHYTADQWNDIVPASCKSGSNSAGTEPCPPTDHDAQYWINQGWNFVMIDWKQWASTSEPKDAEKRLYTAVWNGKTVIDMLYELLIDLLDKTQWHGNELRLVGPSLGSQVVLNLASRIETNASNTYHVSRIALLDHYFSTWGKDYLGKHYPRCVDFCGTSMGQIYCMHCNRFWIGEYARWKLLKNIKESSKGSVIIENYRTSLISSNLDTYLFADENAKLDEKTIFSDLTPDVYDNNLADLGSRHNYAFAEYMHCMKWAEDHGQLNNGAPSCRMDTQTLSNKCDLTEKRWDTACNVHYHQTGGGTTTWDFDNTFRLGNRRLLSAPHIDHVYRPHEGIYRIGSIYSAKSLDCGSNNIIQYTSLGNDNQKFRLISLGNDYYNIKCYTNNKCIDLSVSKNKLQQWPSCYPVDHMQFKFIQQYGSYAIVVGNGKHIEASSVDLVGTWTITYNYDQLFSLSRVPPNSYQPIPEYVTVDGQCHSGGPGEPTTQLHYENGITVADVSFNVCKTRLFEEHVRNLAYIWAEYSGDDRGMCWIGQNTGYTGNGNRPYACILITN